MSKIGNYIRDVMAAKDIKPAKVAKEHPIKYNTLWQVVAGKVLPSDAVLEVVAVAIHEPLSKLRAIASEDRIERLHAKDIAEGLMVKPTPERIINAEETKKKNQEDIIMAILNERKRQDKKWGEQNHLPQFWSGILGEEFGELAQAINETVFDNGSDKGGYENMRTEAIHVAAVAVGFLECLERNKEAWGLAANEEH